MIALALLVAAVSAADPAPADAKAAEAKPAAAEAKPAAAEAKPADAKPAEAKAEDAGAAEEKPAEAKAEEKPAEAKAGEAKAGEAKAGDVKSGGAKPGGANATGGPAARPDVRVTLGSEPQGANVVDAASGALLGVTPLSLQRPSGTSPLRVRVEGEGLIPLEEELSFEHDDTRLVKLARAPRTPSGGGNGPKKGKKPPRPRIDEPAKL
jgi:hypothetical protein